jgi:hypothetical protein
MIKQRFFIPSLNHLLLDQEQPNIVINGIDFNQRLDQAKKRLHRSIDWQFAVHEYITNPNTIGFVTNQPRQIKSDRVIALEMAIKSLGPA